MNYQKPNPELLKELAARGFINTSGCHYQKTVGIYTLRVWVHSQGGQAEVLSRLTRDTFGGAGRIARLHEFDVIEEVDKFFEPYGGGRCSLWCTSPAG